MELQRATHATIVIERNFPVPPERVFAAFSDPMKKRKWFAEGEGFKIDSYELDFRVGGREITRMHFADFPACTNDTYFLVIIPNGLCKTIFFFLFELENANLHVR